MTPARWTLAKQLLTHPGLPLWMFCAFAVIDRALHPSALWDWAMVSVMAAVSLSSIYTLHREMRIAMDASNKLNQELREELARRRDGGAP